MKSSISKLFKSKTIFGKYLVKNLIAKGSFGEVYLGTNIVNKKNYALKIEKAKNGQSILKEEAYILFTLKGPGIPTVEAFGIRGNYHILVENLLGKSIYDIWLSKNRKFNIKDTCMFAIQALERIEYIHSKNYLHRDIKPANFLVGNPDKSQIFLIDFGNARKYRSSRTGKHIPFYKSYKIYGTALFLSLNVLKGIEQTRKDELESLGLVFIYLHKGCLPWSNLKKKTVMEILDTISIIKYKTSLKELCKGLPIEMYEYMNYVSNLNYEDNPNYTHLKNLFENILRKIGQKNDLMFSWIDKKIVPKRITSVNHSKTKKRLYSNIFHSLPFTDINVRTSVDKPSLSVIKNNSDIFRIKNIKNNILENNINKMKVGDYKFKTQKLFRLNFGKNDIKKSGVGIFKIIDNNDLNRRNINTSTNSSTVIKKNVQKNEIINNLNLKCKMPILYQPKMKISKNNISNQNKIINYFPKLDNKINKEETNRKMNLKLNTILNPEIENQKYQYKNKANCININNININRSPNNNVTYVTILKKFSPPKINIQQGNIINPIKYSSIKTTPTRYTLKQSNSRNNEFFTEYQYKPLNYQSVFSRKVEYDKNIFLLKQQLTKYKFNNSSKPPSISKKLENLRQKKKKLNRKKFLNSKTNNNNQTEIGYTDKILKDKSYNRTFNLGNFLTQNDSNLLKEKEDYNFSRYKFI